MIKVLFLIHDLGQGGAEKVLVNLVNNMDREKFDITVISLFGGGVNEQFLNKDINYKIIYSKMIPGNSKIMKLFTPEQLHKKYIKDTYDIEISYLEGPCARIISGCTNPNTKLVSWIHCTMQSCSEFAGSFRNAEEARKCYSRFHKCVFVSKEVEKAFSFYCPVSDKEILYNTNESEQIIALSKEPITDAVFDDRMFKMIGVGKIEKVKRFDRLARIHNRLVKEGYPVQTYILGSGSRRDEIARYVKEEQLLDSFIFLGYQTNPYKYLANTDIFVCSSSSEGFSTAATEALILGTPVVTTPVAGMEELLGKNNEFGIITEMSEESLYRNIRELIVDKQRLEYYKTQAIIRGRYFSKENTVEAVEVFLQEIAN